MNAKVQAVAAQQHGLVTRRQAVACGMRPDRIDRLARSGQWAIVVRGVYAEAAVVDRAETHQAQRILIDSAVSLRTPTPHVRSHHSAAYLLGLGVLHEPTPITHLTRPGLVGTHHRNGVKQHVAPYPEEAVRDIAGVATLDPARTALDITREHGYLQGLVAADSALRAGTDPAQLHEARSVMHCWPQSSVMDDVLASMSADSDSVGETLARDLVRSLGLGEPQVQFGLCANGRTVWCDLRIGRHVFEFDGRVKYQRTDEGGFASNDPGEVLWFEKQRQDFITGFKLGMSRIVRADCFGAGRRRAQERLLREFRDTKMRFGTDIADLAVYRPTTPRPRPGASHRPPAAA